MSDLSSYKKLIDDDINLYVKHLNSRTHATYGESSAMVSSAFTDLLQRGGKRIRGALTIAGYEMCGGTDQGMIIQAARAIEMMHAYMLIIDDIQDRSDVRRGGPSTHKLLESKHVEQQWKGDATHIGTALALNAALLGSHNAGMILAMLDVSDERKVKALNIMNHTIVVTAHGQTNDIVNEITTDVTDEMIENVLQWKTAHYTFLNPIHMGMVLAGAPCEDTNGITPYALHAGKAFQIADDLKVVGNYQDKNAIDDIKEGKQTVLTQYALQHANSDDREFLRICLGNENLSSKAFTQCQEILISSGAVAHAQAVKQRHIETALISLNEHEDRWQKSQVTLLHNLAQSLHNND